MTNAKHAALWDVINEGGEGYRPDYAARRAANVSKQAAAPKVGKMIRDASGMTLDGNKVIARLQKNIAKLPSLTNATAIEIFEKDIAADTALLSAYGLLPQ